MRGHWAVRDSLVDGDRLTVKGIQKVAITKGDRIVALSTADSGLFFPWYSNVAEVARPKRIDDNYQLFEFALEDRTSIDAQPVLKDLAFTLTKIYRYQRPHVHFLRPYVSLSPVDFQSIVEGRLFWARTAFGLFLSSLPTLVVDTFQRELAAHSPRHLVHGSYRELWDSLRHIVVDELQTAHILLDSIRKSCLAPSLDGSGVTFAEFLLFDDESDQVSDSIVDQLARLDAFISSLNTSEEPSLLEQLEREIEASEWEEHFEGVFGKSKWQDLLVS